MSGAAPTQDNPLVIAADFIREFEGLRLTAYQDQRGVWTCGYGSTGPDVIKGTVWTWDQAERRFENDLTKFQNIVGKLTTARLSPKQEAAMISFAYNCGDAAFATSTLLTVINQQDWLNVPAQMIRWDHVDGQPNKGLLIRRLREAALFLEGTP